MIDVLYVAFNRLEFTRQSFEALKANTDWSLVDRLYVHDDGSTDGTWEYLASAVAGLEVDLDLERSRLGGPVATMNWYLDRSARARDEAFAKIDNDFVVCPGWLEAMAATMEANQAVDILGLEPRNGPVVAPGSAVFSVEVARFIGGKGLIRLRSFETSRPSPGGFNGYQGFTQWQEHESPGVVKAWITPDLPCFGIDQLPASAGPWRELAIQYEAQGWGRLWPAYGGDDHSSWWAPV